MNVGANVLVELSVGVCDGEFDGEADGSNVTV